jgi:hypothetical protein
LVAGGIGVDTVCSQEASSVRGRIIVLIAVHTSALCKEVTARLDEGDEGIVVSRGIGVPYIVWLGEDCIAAGCIEGGNHTRTASYQIMSSFDKTCHV